MQQVQRHLSARRVTVGEALDWVLRDIDWCTDPTLPGYGRWSPVVHGILRDALAVTRPAPDSED